MEGAIPWIIGTGITLLGLGAAGFWAVWTRAADARSKLRDQLGADLKEERLERIGADKELAAKIEAGERADSQRDSSLAVLVESVRRMETTLSRTDARFDALAAKVEAHMVQEVPAMEAAVSRAVRSELRASLGDLRRPQSAED